MGLFREGKKPTTFCFLNEVVSEMKRGIRRCLGVEI